MGSVFKYYFDYNTLYLSITLLSALILCPFCYKQELHKCIATLNEYSSTFVFSGTYVASVLIVYSYVSYEWAKALRECINP